MRWGLQMLSLLCEGSFRAAVWGRRPGGSQESRELRVHRADLQRSSPTPALTIRERCGRGGRLTGNRGNNHWGSWRPGTCVFHQPHRETSQSRKCQLEYPQCTAWRVGQSRSWRNRALEPPKKAKKEAWKDETVSKYFPGNLIALSDKAPIYRNANSPLLNEAEFTMLGI